jgi:arylsulfatase A-like enzyme
MIRRMDQGVGRVLDALDRYGVRDNTLVVFTSDNGPQFGGTGGHCLNRFNCGFHGAKGSTYDGGIRAPLIARWPAGFDGGRAVDRMTHMTDWFSTLAAVAGGRVPTDRTIDGWDVSPLLFGEPCEVNTRRFWQWNRYTPRIECNAGMRDGDWKLVRPAIREAMAVPDIQWLHTCMYEHEHFIEHGVITEPDPPRDVPPPPPAELYNLTDDPGEERDLAAEQPERAARMLRELETWFEEVEAERATIDDVW